MRRTAHLNIRGKKEILNLIYDDIKDDAEKVEIMEYKNYGCHLEVIVDEAKESYNLLMNAIRSNNLGYTFWEKRDYSKKELQSALFLNMPLMSYGVNEGNEMKAETYGTKYEKVNICGCEKKQISDLITDVKKISKYDIAEVPPAIVVSEKVYQIINENQFSGCEFKPVKDYKGRKEITIYQLIIPNVLPLMSPEIIVENRHECNACGKIIGLIRSDVVYEADHLKNALDFNLTKEDYTPRTIIISRRVYEALNENKIKSYPQPVRIIGDTTCLNKQSEKIVLARKKEGSEQKEYTSVKQKSLVNEKTLTLHLNKYGLEKQGKMLKSMMKSSVRMVTIATKEENLIVGTSKIGGCPDLPKTLNWPECDGSPLSFIAQINLSEIANCNKEGNLPQKGILYFFYDAMSQPWGYDTMDKKRWKVLYYSGNDADIIRTSIPSKLQEEEIFDACKLELRNEMTLLPADSYDIKGYQLSNEDADMYYDMIEGLEEVYKEEDERIHRFLGHPNQIQGDMQLECQLVSNGLYCGDQTGYNDPKAKQLEEGASDWQLLLQIDSDENTNMMWGDNGRIYFWIKKQDIEKLNFDNVWVILQCE